MKKRKNRILYPVFQKYMMRLFYIHKHLQILRSSGCSRAPYTATQIQLLSTFSPRQIREKLSTSPKKVYISARELKKDWNKLKPISLKHLQGQPSEYVEISKLPLTAIRSDITKLLNDYTIGGETSIVDMAFPRDLYFQPLGRVIIQFRDIKDAQIFASQALGTLIGGSRIQLRFLDGKTNWIKVSRPQELGNYSGQAVLISGLPPRVGDYELRDWLIALSFCPNDNTAESVIMLEARGESKIGKALVKLANENDAWRCVRKLHGNMYKMRIYDNRWPLRVSVVY